MKLSHLKQIATYLKKFKKISAIYRVSDTIIKIAFDKDDEVFFDMQRSNSKIFKCSSYPRTKIYNAPFDVILSKRFNRANILDIEIINDDKILRFKTSLASAYKEQITYLQFEFTGKYTNVIVLDEQNTVIEALRHIDLFSSFREVRVGQKLLDIPKAPYTPKEYPLDDVEQFLYDVYAKDMEQKLLSLKRQKLSYLDKKLKKLQKLFDKLEDENQLRELQERYQHYGNLILSNIHLIKPYSKEIELNDYDESKIKIKLDKEFSSAADMAEYFFTQSKKAKQKANNLHIEMESLSSKIEHIKLFMATVNGAEDISKIMILFPAKNMQHKKDKKDDSIEVFWIEGYKVQLGKNERGNVELLKSARAKDVWLHMRDQPSCHVIITTDKQNLPDKIIQAAARLCVDFTTTSQDRYLVDYTPRREVSIQSGANVLYNKYKTVEVDTRS